jgi:FkbM family methyltransferase
MTVPAEWAIVTGGPLRGREILHDQRAAWQEAMLDGSFDSFIYEAIERLGGISGDAVWDVGAHFGYHTLAFAQLVGSSGSVVAFEPNPANLDRLHENLARNHDLSARVQVMPMALADADGEQTFVFSRAIASGQSSGSHLERAMVPSPIEEYASFQRATVPTRTADSVWRDGQLPAPDAIKIDVEGAESLVLDGAADLLHAQRPTLFLEVHNITQMFLVQERLIRAGYRTEILDPDHATVSRCFVLAVPRENEGDRPDMRAR